MKTFKILFSLIILAVFGACSSDEESDYGQISGSITDAETGNPIKSATVSLSPDERSQSTDSEGAFYFGELAPGSYTISVSADGYSNGSRRLTVTPGLTTSGDLSLKPIEKMGDLEVTSRTITFDPGINELSLGIRNVGNEGNIEWTISNITVDWLTVTPRTGSTRRGMTTTVKVIVDRSILGERSANTNFVIESSGYSIPVNVQVNKKSSGNEGEVTGTLEGRVFSSSTDKGIENASVVVTPGNKTAVTDVNGLFTLRDMAPGSYEVEVMHSAYNTKRENVTIYGGQTASIKVYLEEGTTTVSASKNEIDFGTSSTSATITLNNSGDMQAKWNADITYQPAWLSLSRTSGTINAGSSQSVTLTVDRKKVTEDDTFYLDIEGNFLPEIIKISVSKSSGGGDDPGKPEDYSGATIISCDSRVTAQIVSCRRSGSSVEFKYVLTNNGMGSVNDWRIYPPKSMSLIQGGTRSVVWTNDGEEYLYPYMTFRDKYTSGSNVITATFPEGVPCSGSVTISDVSSSATKFNLTLGVYAYPNSTYHMSSSAIKFTNVPIY